jgi:hypothetical protein
VASNRLRGRRDAPVRGAVRQTIIGTVRLLQAVLPNRIPSVAVVEALFLIVEQLLPRLGGKFHVWPFDDGVDWAGLFAKTTVYAIRHIDVVHCEGSLGRCGPCAASPS